MFGFSTKASTRRLYWIVQTDLAPVASYVACDEAMQVAPNSLFRVTEMM